MRRQFFDLTKTVPAPIADAALRRIAALYKIEAEIRVRIPVNVISHSG
jgi:transposase